MGDDSKDNLQLPSNLADAERFQRLFVAPMVDAAKTEIRTFCTQLRSEFSTEQTEQKQLRADVDTLKSNQRRALIGWGAWATGVSVFVGFCGDWIKRKFGINS